MPTTNTEATAPMIDPTAIHLVESLLRDLANVQRSIPAKQRAAFDAGVRLAKLNANIDGAPVTWSDLHIAAYREHAFPDVPEGKL